MNPQQIKALLRTLIVLAVAVLAGVLVERAGWPLAWVLGPLLVVAGAGLCGITIQIPQICRRIGQMVVGAAIGLQITPGVAGQILLWLPVMVASALLSVAISAVISRYFAARTGLDPATSYFSLLPGGMAEMANIGQAFGARADVVAVSQTIRLAMVVFLLPPLCRVLVDSGTNTVQTEVAEGLGVLATLGLLAVAGLGVAITRALRLNNPWMIGALLAVGTVAATGLVQGTVAHPLLAWGQFMIGISIGTRFRRDILQRMPMVVAGSVLAVLVMSCILGGLGLILARIGGLDPGTALLATSAGGIAEMTLTAQSLALNAPLVAGFHFVRAVVVNGFAAHAWQLMHRTAAGR